MNTLYKLSEYYSHIVNNFVNTKSEVNFLDKIFAGHNVKNVLDLACGIGRHAIPLAKKGYIVTGIDYSPYQIKKAIEDSKIEKVGVNFILQNVNVFSYPNKFDAAMIMWTTIGEKPIQYKKVIKNVYTSLKKGGIFVIDNKSWEYIPKNNKKVILNTIKTKEGIIKTRIHDKYTKKLRVRDIVHFINGKKYKDKCVTYILKEGDLVSELRKEGFRHLEIYHNNKKKRLKKPARIVIVAVK